MSVSIEYQLPRLLPGRTHFAVANIIDIVLPLLCVSFGALAAGAVAAAVSVGLPVPFALVAG